MSVILLTKNVLVCITFYISILLMNVFSRAHQNDVNPQRKDLSHIGNTTLIWIIIILHFQDDKIVIRHYYSGIQRGDEIINVRDSVLLKAGTRRKDQPFVARVSGLWEEHDGMCNFILSHSNEVRAVHPCSMSDIQFYLEDKTLYRFIF